MDIQQGVSSYTPRLTDIARLDDSSIQADKSGGQTNTAPTDRVSHAVSSGKDAAIATGTPAVDVVETAPSDTAATFAASASNLAAVTEQISRLSSTGPDRGITRSDVTKGIVIFQTLLNVAEKALDGLPIWSLKAGVATASEILRNVQVRRREHLPYCISSMLHRTRLRTTPRSTTYARMSRKCN
jgi:hypothetical protein